MNKVTSIDDSAQTLPPVLDSFSNKFQCIGFGLQIKGGIRDEFIPVHGIQSDMKYEPNDDATQKSHRQQYSSVRSLPIQKYEHVSRSMQPIISSATSSVAFLTWKLASASAASIYYYVDFEFDIILCIHHVYVHLRHRQNCIPHSVR